MKLNESDFRTLLDTSNDAVIAAFSAGWCGPCKAFAPIFDAVEKNKKSSGFKAVFAKLDVDECIQLCEDLNVTVVPTLMIFKNSKVIARVQGGFPNEKTFDDFVVKSIKQ